MWECWLALIGSGQARMADRREHSKQLSGSTKQGISWPVEMLSFQERLCNMEAVESRHRILVRKRYSAMQLCFKSVCTVQCMHAACKWTSTGFSHPRLLPWTDQQQNVSIEKWNSCLLRLERWTRARAHTHTHTHTHMYPVMHVPITYNRSSWERRIFTCTRGCQSHWCRVHGLCFRHLQ